MAAIRSTLNHLQGYDVDIAVDMTARRSSLNHLQGYDVDITRDMTAIRSSLNRLQGYHDDILQWYESHTSLTGSFTRLLRWYRPVTLQTYVHNWIIYKAVVTTLAAWQQYIHLQGYHDDIGQQHESPVFITCPFTGYHDNRNVATIRSLKFHRQGYCNRTPVTWQTTCSLWYF